MNSGTIILGSVRARSANRGQGGVAHDQPVPDAKAVADVGKGLAFARFGTLSVAHVHGGCIVVPGSECGADAGVHSSAEEDDRAGVVVSRWH